MSLITYQTRIEDLIGDFSDTTVINNALKDVAREIINILPPILLESMTYKREDTNGNGIALEGSSKILYADKGGYEARQVHAKSRERYEDSNSLFKATAKSPVFYVYDDKGHVIPGGGNLYTIYYPLIAYDDNYGVYASGNVVIQEMEPLIVLGAAVRLRMLQLIEKRADLPAALDLSSITIPEKPSAPVFSYTDVTSSPIEAQTVTITGDAPTYTAPVLSFSDFPTVAALEISASGLSVPIPVFSVPDITTVTVALTELDPTPPAYDYALVDTELGELATLIDTEEDEELARAKLSQIQVIISNALNQFNEEQVLYAALIQKAIIDAQTAAAEAQTEGSLVLQTEYQEYTSQLQKYGADVQKYQVDTANEIQVFQQNLGKELQVWQTSRQSELQAYSANIQNNLNVFQKESAEYQAKLQVNLLDAQQAQQAVSTDAQLSTDVDKTNKLQVLQKEVQEYASVLQKYSADLQQYTTEIGTEIQQFTNNTQIIMTEHGLMAQELQGLQGLYAQELQLLTGGQQSGG